MAADLVSEAQGDAVRAIDKLIQRIGRMNAAPEERRRLQKLTQSVHGHVYDQFERLKHVR